MATIEERLTAAGQDVSQLTGGEATTTGAPSGSVNVGQYERWASAVGGGALALLGAALVQRGVTGHCDVYEAMNFSTAGDTPLRNSENVSVPAERGTKVEKSVTINRPASELYRFWRNFENLPRFMRHLRSVRDMGNRSHWVATLFGEDPECQIAADLDHFRQMMEGGERPAAWGQASARI